MTRSNARELAAHLIYALDYTDETPQQAIDARLEKEYYAALAEENEVYTERPSRKQLDYIKNCVAGVAARKEELDGLISHYSIGWGLHRISHLTKAALRLAMYETLYVEDVPAGVAINECLELVRKYEDEEVVSFVNGILGSFARGLQHSEVQQ